MPTIAHSVIHAQYEEDSRVESAEIKDVGKGPYIELTPTDRLAASDLRRERNDEPVYIEITDPQPS